MQRRKRREMMKRFYIDPWVKLVARQHRMRQRHWHNPYQSATGLDQAIQEERQRLLASDLSLEELVQRNEMPVEESVVRLSRYLAKRTAYFLFDENKRVQLEDPEEYCFSFFYFTIQLYARCQIDQECIDNLIQMAECFERDPENLPWILDAALYDESDQSLVMDCWRWATERSEPVPGSFKKCVQAAIAVLTGIMNDPMA